MITSTCEMHGLDGHAKSISFHNNRYPRLHQPSKSNRNNASINTVIVVEFRDEVYAAIAEFSKQNGLVTCQAKNATELASKVVRHKAELVLVNGTQPDESAWLTSAKLKIVDASRAVWIYAPERPNALDTWLSMAGIDDIIVYEDAIPLLIEHLERRVRARIASP